MATRRIARAVGRADRRRAAGPGRRLLPEPEDAALEQPPARLHRRRDRRRRQVPVLRHRVPAEAGREGPRALSESERERAVTRTLVVAPQWIGDAVMAEPLLATLAERGERLTVAALPWVAPVFRAMPRGRRDRSSCRSRTAGSTGRARRRVAGDAARPLRRRLRAAELAQVGARAVARAHPGARRLSRRRPLAAAQPAPRRTRPGGRRWSRSTARSPARPSTPARGRGCSSTPRAARRDARRGTACSAARYWTFAPGAEYGPAKRWPAAHYAALARSLHDADGAPIVLLGSPGEAALCDEIAAHAGGACRVLAGQTSLLDAIALIAAARGLASNDSGLMHVAAALRRAAGRGVRLDQPAAHAAAQRARARPLAEGRARSSTACRASTAPAASATTAA